LPFAEHQLFSCANNWVSFTLWTAPLGLLYGPLLSRAAVSDR
jgi:hypothetical protein